MCHIPNTAVFVHNLLNAFLVLFSPLVTIQVAPEINDTTKNFIFYIS